MKALKNPREKIYEPPAVSVGVKAPRLVTAQKTAKYAGLADRFVKIHTGDLFEIPHILPSRKRRYRADAFFPVEEKNRKPTEDSQKKQGRRNHGIPQSGE